MKYPVGCRFCLHLRQNSLLLSHPDYVSQALHVKTAIEPSNAQWSLLPSPYLLAIHYNLSITMCNIEYKTSAVEAGSIEEHNSVALRHKYNSDFRQEVELLVVVFFFFFIIIILFFLFFVVVFVLVIHKLDYFKDTRILLSCTNSTLIHSILN
jgi:hypothetical protein